MVECRCGAGVSMAGGGLAHFVWEPRRCRRDGIAGVGRVGTRRCHLLTPVSRSRRLQDIAHRRPFEPILICRPASGQPPAPAAGAAADGAAQLACPSVAGSPRPGHQPPEAPADIPSGAGAAAVAGTAAAGAAAEASGAPAAAPLEEPIPDGLVLLSVPTQHSRKPHLGPLLRRYLPPEPRCLEVGWYDACAGGRANLKLTSRAGRRAASLPLEAPAAFLHLRSRLAFLPWHIPALLPIPFCCIPLADVCAGDVPRLGQLGQRGAQVPGQGAL